MYKLRNFVSKKILVGIYYSLVYPFLIYVIPVWDVANDSIINPIKVLQKKIVRLITSPIFYRLDISIVSDIFKLRTAKFVYNCVNLLAPNQFSNFYTFTNSNYNTAASRKELLKVPRAMTTNYG